MTIKEIKPGQRFIGRVHPNNHLVESAGEFSPSRALVKTSDGWARAESVVVVEAFPVADEPAAKTELTGEGTETGKAKGKDKAKGE